MTWDDILAAKEAGGKQDPLMIISARLSGRTRRCQPSALTCECCWIGAACKLRQDCGCRFQVIGALDSKPVSASHAEAFVSGTAAAVGDLSRGSAPGRGLLFRLCCAANVSSCTPYSLMLSFQVTPVEHIGEVLDTQQRKPLDVLRQQVKSR